MKNKTLDITTCSLLNLLQQDLQIAAYQRPYSWQVDQVKLLVDDLCKRKNNDLLIMGGIILHEENGEINIVDGQQRLITFSILKCIFDKKDEHKSKLLTKEFKHIESIVNIENNARFINLYKKKNKEISFENIHFVVVKTSELDDAFAFFDSQNTRGKKLEDFDVLKAHHLRFIKDDALALDCVKDWEKIEKLKQEDPSNIGLGLLLETYLARGRKWTNKVNAEPLIREEFKSQRNEKKDTSNYLLSRYQQAALFSSWQYQPSKEKVLKFKFENNNSILKPDSIEIHQDLHQFFPFQITQTIEGGELFFWYTQKYYELTNTIFSSENNNTTAHFKSLMEGIKGLDSKPSCVLIKEVFKAAIIFYVDKFGYENLDNITKGFFFSLYKLRFNLYSISLKSVYKYIKDDFNPFLLIQEASFSEYIVSFCEEYNSNETYSAVDFIGIRKEIINTISWPPNSELFFLINDSNRFFYN